MIYGFDNVFSNDYNVLSLCMLLRKPKRKEEPIENTMYCVFSLSHVYSLPIVFDLHVLERVEYQLSLLSLPQCPLPHETTDIMRYFFVWALLSLLGFVNIVLGQGKDIFVSQGVPACSPTTCFTNIRFLPCSRNRPSNINTIEPCYLHKTKSTTS